MKKFYSLFLTTLLVFGLTTLQAQDKNNPWQFSFGANAVDVEADSQTQFADFFDVEKYPTAKLSIKNSKVIEKLEDGKYKMLVNGDMTVKSKTNPISFEAIIDLDSDIKTAQGILTFNRDDFDVQYRSEMHLDDPKSFWNKLQNTRETAKDKVIDEEIEIQFNVVSMPGVLSK